MYYTFKNPSFNNVLKRAEEFLHQYESVNRPLQAKGDSVIPVKSETTASAKPDGSLSFNFSFSAVQAMMVEAVPEAEAVLDELEHRMTLSRLHARKARDTCDKLGREISVFLDSLRWTGALDEEEMLALTVESVRPPFEPPMR